MAKRGRSWTFDGWRPGQFFRAAGIGRGCVKSPVSSCRWEKYLRKPRFLKRHPILRLVSLLNARAKCRVFPPLRCGQTFDTASAEIGHWATYEPDSADPGQGSTGWITQNQRASIRDLSTCRDFAGQVIRWDEGQDPVSKWVWLPMLAVRDSGARRI